MLSAGVWVFEVVSGKERKGSCTFSSKIVLKIISKEYSEKIVVCKTGYVTKLIFCKLVHQTMNQSLSFLLYDTVFFNSILRKENGICDHFYFTKFCP